MADEQGGQPPAEKPDSQPFAPSPRIAPPEKGEVAEIGTRKPEQDTKDSKQLAKDVHWLQHATFWSQIGLGVIGIAALVIYYCQLQQMVKATKATQDAVCVASRTLAETVRSNKAQEAANTRSFNATIANFQQDQRAWISISDPQFTPTGILIRLENSGRTPAINVAINCCSFGDQSIYIPPPTFEQRARQAAKLSSKIPDADAQVIAAFKAHAKDSPEALRRYQERLKLSEDWKKNNPVWKHHGVIGPNASPIYSVSGGRNTISENDRASYTIGEITYNDIYTKTVHHTSICIVQTKFDPLGICGDGQKMD
jgi:hypothetical protein